MMAIVDLQALFYPILVAAGLLAGFLNTMAGGGSLLTMPLMIFLGLPAATANGSNRVAILPQSLAAARGFHKAGFSDLKMSLTLSACTIPGAILGAMSAVTIGDAWFRKVLAAVMVGVLLATLWPRRKAATAREPLPAPSRARVLAAHAAMVLVGFYGGFVQAGVGFIMMPVLQRLLRLDLVRVNMHKVLVTGIYTVPALAVFALNRQVDWMAGVVLGAGSMVGAMVATRMQIKRGEGPVRLIFAVAVVAMAIKLAM